VAERGSGAERGPGEESESAEARAYRRGFKQKSRRDDFALDLFHEIRAKLDGDLARVDAVLRELSRLYNPLTDGPIVDLATRARIMTLLHEGRPGEAEALLEERYRLYAPFDDAERHGPTGPGS
jgi:hypothetical protein